MAEAKIYYQQDCDLNKLKGKTVAIIGYGSQGHAHALNLKESGVNVVVGLYKGSKSWEKAEKQGLKVMLTADAVKASVADVVTINGSSASSTINNKPMIVMGDNGSGSVVKASVVSCGQTSVSVD